MYYNTCHPFFFGGGGARGGVRGCKILVFSNVYILSRKNLTMLMKILVLGNSPCLRCFFFFFVAQSAE